MVRSAPDAVALALSRHTAPQNNAAAMQPTWGRTARKPLHSPCSKELFLKAEANGNGAISKSTCPDCRGFLVHQEGCERCPSCGYEKCG